MGSRLFDRLFRRGGLPREEGMFVVPMDTSPGYDPMDNAGGVPWPTSAPDVHAYNDANAEVAALRATLERIVDHHSQSVRAGDEAFSPPGTKSTAACDCTDCQIMRAALAENDHLQSVRGLRPRPSNKEVK